MNFAYPKSSECGRGGAGLQGPGVFDGRACPVYNDCIKEKDSFKHQTAVNPQELARYLAAHRLAETLLKADAR
jgi:hypothetical protein